MLVDIEGVSAVGKTTLIQSLQEAQDNMGFAEIPFTGRPEKLEIYGRLTREGFLANQLWFMQRTIDRYLNAQEHDQRARFCLLDSGVLAIVLFTRFFPVIRTEDCSVYQDFCSALLKKYSPSLPLSSVILYLDADAETIRQRKRHDPARTRDNHESNLWFLPFYRRAIAIALGRRPNTVFSLSAEQSVDVIRQKCRHLLTIHGPAANCEPWTLASILEIVADIDI